MASCRSRRLARVGKDATALITRRVSDELGRAPARCLWLRGALLVVMCALWMPAAKAQIGFPAPRADDPIQVSARNGHRWREGDQDVWLLEGDCVVTQGGTTVVGRDAVLWVHQTDGAERTRVSTYLEGDVRIRYQGSTQQANLSDESWFGEFHSSAAPQIEVAATQSQPLVDRAIYQNALSQRAPKQQNAIRRTQFQVIETPSSPFESVPPGTRRIRAFPRSMVAPNVRFAPTGNGDESVVVIDGGVNLIIDGVAALGTVDIATDRMVIWTSGLNQLDLGGQSLQRDDMPLEIYMEGNLVFRQGDRVIHAQRMYYDATREIGLITDAELLTPVESYECLLRMKADVLRLIHRDRFLGERAYVTSSRLARPGYRLQSGNFMLEDYQQPVLDPATGMPLVNPLTGEPEILHDRTATSRNNFLFLGPVPVFYWPVVKADLEEPTFYLRRARLRNDNIFGSGIMTTWNLYQILGIDPPEGTVWDANIDYLSNRGLGFGSIFQYNRLMNTATPGVMTGVADAWFINDQDNDTLGSDRTDVPIEETFRGRFLGRHRQPLPYDLRLTAELGWHSDRNFLEQYYENEFDQFKDQITGVEIKRLNDVSSWSITADGRLNDFFTQTEWLPRADHFLLGQSLLGDRLTWFEHTSIGYARLGVAETPDNPVDAAKFLLRPWEVPSEGERVVTRQEIDLPISLGFMQITPYALGEAGHWGEDLTGNDTQRLYGQAGVRASLPIWSANPLVEMPLFNVHGLAHKIMLNTEFAYADASRDVTDFPLYDPLDDDVTEQFRRRFGFNTFNPATGVIPPLFDERFYAVRSGIAGSVTTRATEIADDLMYLRFGARQRLQTKRGMPENRRIIDWMVLDTNATFFPEDERDNFGESLGLINYDYRWHVGDRFTLLSSGLFDLFADGQQVVRVGGYLNRPPRSSAYLGMDFIEGPVQSQVLSLSYSYRMSPKWISTFGTAFDIAGNGNIGQSLAVTRIGESFLTSFGFSIDASKQNVGLTLSIEPRFLPTQRLRGISGAQIPVAGAYGLE